MAQDKEESYTCFFYGTLMSVDILKRVIGTSSDHLEFADALLKDHTRHHVKGVDYPAVVPAKDGAKIIGRELTDEEASVRGTVVKGLTKPDIRFLDIFEGDEYTRATVSVELLSPFKDANSKDQTSEDVTSSSAQVSADVYIWVAPLKMLQPSLWTFAEFMREKAHMWIGGEGQDNPEFVKVDERRQMEGQIVHNGNGYLHFGHSIGKKEWTFEPGYINLNHGGLGAMPKCVGEARRRWLDLYESSPDKFWSKTYFPAYKIVKERTARFLNCEEDEFSFVLNTTTGVNVILRSIRWQKRDHILYFPSAVYGACHNTLLYLRDHYNLLDLQLVPVEFDLPINHGDIVAKARKVIEDTLASLGPGERLHLALVDGIVSRPGVVMPWEALCSLFAEYNLLSLIDGAHLMGQVKLDFNKVRPDFLVTNAHKWCFASRSLAVLHVPKKNHHLIEAFPVSFGYVSSQQPKTINTPSAFASDFAYNGTQDISNILSLSEAFDFRERCGGEEEIISYNHDLVTRGADFVAATLGTRVLQNEEKSLVACMANVLLAVPEDIDASAYGQVAGNITKLLITEYNIAAPAFVFQNQVWIRLAAQIYNEISDFEKLAAALKELLADKEKLLQT